MRKVWLGCGVVALVLVLGVGSCVFGSYKLMRTTFKDIAAASEAVQNTPVDRLERDAEDISAAALRERLAQLTSRPVRLTGTVSPWDGGKSGSKPSNDARMYFFVEPAVLVYGYMMAFDPADLPAGAAVEVLGVAARVDLNTVPFLDADARQRAAQALGGHAEIPVVVAAKVMRLGAPGAAAAVPAAADAGTAPPARP